MGKDLKGKELGKGICQRKNGKYHARFTNRFGKREDLYGDTLKEVKNKLALSKSNDAKEKNVISPNTTLDEWYEKWMKIYKEPVIRLNTKRNYDDIYRVHISPILGKRRISEITKLQITALLNGIAKNGYKYGTLNKVRAILVDLMNKATEDEFINKNPTNGVRLPMHKPKNDVKTLTQEEQRLFLECSNGTFYYNLFIVALNTGLRPGELFALTEDDIDFKKKTINISKTLLYQKLDGDEQKEFHLEPPKTANGYRSVPINNICEQALLRQIKQRNVIRNRMIISEHKNERKTEFADLLFVTKFGTPVSTDVYTVAIDKIVKEINSMLDPLEQMDSFSGHTFRHTFATRCFEADIPPKTVQTYLGHGTLKMTMDLYTTVLESKKQEDIKKLECLNIEINESEYENNVIQFCS